MREVGGEPRQVRGGRSTPAVNGLNRVTNGGQRQIVVKSAAEQRRQRDALSVTSILVFVEEDDAVTTPKLLAHNGMRYGQPCRRRHLLAEVHHLVGSHSRVQRVDEWHQLRAF